MRVGTSRSPTPPCSETLDSSTSTRGGRAPHGSFRRRQTFGGHRTGRRPEHPVDGSKRDRALRGHSPPHQPAENDFPPKISAAEGAATPSRPSAGSGAEGLPAWSRRPKSSLPLLTAANPKDLPPTDQFPLGLCQHGTRRRGMTSADHERPPPASSSSGIGRSPRARRLVPDGPQPHPAPRDWKTLLTSAEWQRSTRAVIPGWAFAFADWADERPALARPAPFAPGSISRRHQTERGWCAREAGKAATSSCSSMQPRDLMSAVGTGRAPRARTRRFSSPL